MGGKSNKQKIIIKYHKDYERSKLRVWWEKVGCFESSGLLFWGFKEQFMEESIALFNVR